MKFFKLFKPLTLHPNVKIRNRFVIPAMHLNSAAEGFINKKIIEFYRRRAQGGAGLIIIGGMGVSIRGQGVPLMVGLYDDKFIPGLTQLTSSVKKEGTKIIAQLYHAGAYAHSKLTGEQSVSSSAIYSRFSHETPKALTTEECVEVQDKIVEAAKRAQKSGFDGVELLSSAGYLLDQFLSPLKNKRTDKYGGETLEERLTFPLELIKKVKAAVGEEMAVGIRFSGDDFVKGSNTYIEKKIIAKAYEKMGLNYINVTGGWHETRVPQIAMETPHGAFTYLAKEIKSVVTIPVFSSNRINDPILAEQTLQDGYADAICFGRPTIADPDLPKKIMLANSDINSLKNVRKCIGCNQGCFDNIFNLKELRCMVNPSVMQELKYDNVEKEVGNDDIFRDKKKVVIIGGGPAGLEAAKQCAILGYDVSLYEKSNVLGGQINVAWVPHGRTDFKYIISYYEYVLNKLKVPIHFGKEMNAEQILALNPDIVFCATGVHFNKPPISGIKGDKNCNICTADDALAGDFPIGKRVVIVGGAATGVETAIWAAKRGAMDPEVAQFLSYYDALPIENAMKRTYKSDREVYLIEILPKVGSSVGKSTKWIFLDELKKLGINVMVNAAVQEFKDNAVYFALDDNPKIQVIDNVDTIILATGVVSNKDLENELKLTLKQKEIAKKVKIIPIGDARKVASIVEAIATGFKKARKLQKK